MNPQAEEEAMLNRRRRAGNTALIVLRGMVAIVIIFVRSG